MNFAHQFRDGVAAGDLQDLLGFTHLFADMLTADVSLIIFFLIFLFQFFIVFYQMRSDFKEGCVNCDFSVIVQCSEERVQKLVYVKTNSNILSKVTETDDDDSDDTDEEESDSDSIVTIVQKLLLLFCFYLPILFYHQKTVIFLLSFLLHLLCFGQVKLFFFKLSRTYYFTFFRMVFIYLFF